MSLALLAIVDNYGYLCLDIAWAHYRLQKIESLKDAREKLRAARALDALSGGSPPPLTDPQATRWSVHTARTWSA